MSAFTEALAHRIGPMPAGAWAALVAGGLGIAYYTRSHPAASASTVDTAAAQELDNTVTGTSAVPYTGSGAGEISTNDQWQARAVTYLISQGATGTSADEAVRNYLAGNTLTASQTALIDLVLAALGAPPSAPPLPLSGQVGDNGHPAGSSGGVSTSVAPAPVAQPNGGTTQTNTGLFLVPTASKPAAGGTRTVTSTQVLSQTDIQRLAHGQDVSYLGSPEQVRTILAGLGWGPDQIASDASVNYWA